MHTMRAGIRHGQNHVACQLAVNSQAPCVCVGSPDMGIHLPYHCGGNGSAPLSAARGPRLSLEIEIVGNCSVPACKKTALYAGGFHCKRLVTNPKLRSKLIP